MKNYLILISVFFHSSHGARRTKDDQLNQLMKGEFPSQSHRGLWNRQVLHQAHSKGLMPDTVTNPFDRMGKSRPELETSQLSQNNPFGGRLPLPGQHSTNVNRNRLPVRITPLYKAPTSTTRTTSSTTTTTKTTESSSPKKKNKQLNKKKDKLSKKQRKAQQRKERRNKLKNTLSLVRAGGGSGKLGFKKKNKNKDGKNRIQISPLARAGMMPNGTNVPGEDDDSWDLPTLGTMPIHSVETTHVFKNHLVTIRQKTYVEHRKKITEFGENLGRSGNQLPTGPTSDSDANPYCASSVESMGKDLKGVKCPPGQVWAFNKNPRCSLSFSDAVYENASPDCPDPSSVASDYSCVCPCKRKYLLTFLVDFDIQLSNDDDADLEIECQLCRSEKQILLHGLNLSLMDEKKCERTIRRATKEWLNDYKYKYVT